MLVGCQGSTQTPQPEAHEHEHEGPATFAEGVAELQSIAAAVRKAMENNSPDDAHDPLHEVGHLLKALPGLAADLSDDAQQIVQGEADKLFDAFGKIDSAFHKADGDREGAFEAVAEQIDASVAAIVATLPKTASQASDGSAAGSGEPEAEGGAEQGAE
jgi:signal transduction protein with GAF and PtsI domain